LYIPDSRRLAYRIVETGNKSVMVVDGNEGKQYDYTDIPRFSTDSQRMAYEAAVGDQWLVVVDGKEGKPYDGIAEGSLTFSPDSRRVVYSDPHRNATDFAQWIGTLHEN
jgi:Tol biopolymer transport system component